MLSILLQNKNFGIFEKGCIFSIKGKVKCREFQSLQFGHLFWALGEFN